MNKEMEMLPVSSIAAELESARAEFESLGSYASASRAERAAYRLMAAQEAWETLQNELAA